MISDQEGLNKAYHAEDGLFEETNTITLFIAGIRNLGTKAAILSFLKNIKDLETGNQFNDKIFSKVVEGVDLDSDGTVDSVEVLE